jgi:heparinase II/III-like protein
MGPAEVVGRVRDVGWQRRLRGAGDRPVTPLAERRFRATLDPGTLAAIPDDAAARLVGTADRIMAGEGRYFGVPRRDLVNPDWSLDPVSGRHAPLTEYTFDIDHRDETVVGDIKQVWEPSRHQHLTVLAAAHARTGDDRYAHRVADHLKSWWAANPPLRGVHWRSGIELGIRLISWVWTRRLLDGWAGAAGLFEENPEALHQIWWHQHWLATFPSRGSSANNHVLAEAAGALAAACAFDWFAESARWRDDARTALDTHLRRNTFDSGLNRELATEYHGFVLELVLAAAAEDAGLPTSTWHTVRRMTDTLASIVDEMLHPPRQGDGDDGYGLILDGDGTDRWASLLATGAALFGACDWWPKSTVDVRTTLLAALAQPPELPDDRPVARVDHFADAGLTILRRNGIWCRCDGGPHGFGGIAAHAHADALSIEVRHRGVDILADPGTYCYHTEPEWRRYFRSSLGHNTLELDGTDQSGSGGPFLWTRHATAHVLVAHTPPSGVARWTAQHDGYRVPHVRTVELDDTELRIHDRVADTVRHPCRLAFHLGPTVHIELDDAEARLTWPGGAATLDLPAGLFWRAHHGETTPPLGWYSPGFGRKVPTTTLVGTGAIGGDDVLTTVLRYGT